MTNKKPPLSDVTSDATADAPAPLAGEEAAHPTTPLGVSSQHRSSVPRHACVIPRPGEPPVCGELVESTGQPLAGNKDDER